MENTYYNIIVDFGPPLSPETSASDSPLRDEMGRGNSRLPCPNWDAVGYSSSKTLDERCLPILFYLLNKTQTEVSFLCCSSLTFPSSPPLLLSLALAHFASSPANCNNTISNSPFGRSVWHLDRLVSIPNYFFFLLISRSLHR